MRNRNLLLVVMVAFAIVMGPHPSAAAKTSKMHTTAGKPAEHSLSGCLSGPNAEGVYLLKSRHSREGGGLDELGGHVGHKVKLTGHWVASGAEIGEKPEAKQEKEKERHFKVDKLEMVAESCTPVKHAKAKTKGY